MSMKELIDAQFNCVLYLILNVKPPFKISQMFFCLFPIML